MDHWFTRPSHLSTWRLPMQFPVRQFAILKGLGQASNTSRDLAYVKSIDEEVPAKPSIISKQAARVDLMSLHSHSRMFVPHGQKDAFRCPVASV